MEPYFDNAATTYVDEDVAKLVYDIMTDKYGNPSSKHRKGMEAEQYIREARETFSDILKVSGKWIVFTSGGTESNNLALIGAAKANKRAGKHIITTPIEHASVYNPLLYLEKQGFELSFLEVDEYGKVKLDSLKELLREDTILVSIMTVNNEIGTIEPIEECAKIVKEYNKDIVFHSDGVQAFGKLNLYPSRIGVDLYSISGHKLHSPKGVGALYINPKIKLNPQILGGGQQWDFRSGTENVPGIAGLSLATRKAYDKLDERVGHFKEIKDALTEGVMTIEGVRNNSGDAPHVASFSFEGVKSEVLLHALEDKGIYVSSGSACSSNHPGISGVLKAIGLPKELLDSTIRFSFSERNTIEEVEYTVEALKELVPVLRQFVAR